MLIGILSDTHDKEPAMKAAIATLRQAGAEFYIHCGDVGGERIIDHFAGLQAAFVWGNNDFDRGALAEYAAGLGVACHGDLADLTLGGKRFAVMHGDDFALMKRVLDGQEYDYLLHGHTHLRADKRMGRTRVINPGAMYRAREKTVAVLNTELDQLHFMVVQGA